ncbi:helix-turn-helix domain-containing protein [Saccharopolyspora taberi]|uniref:Helix-turn-helix domain-containing protein n=1 Tax=Saccharopolyspora taberi TaxID=60895 RepID=A0ABN3VCD3_9PSEU
MAGTSDSELVITVGMSAETVRQLPPSLDLVSAARTFGIGRTKAYELARSGEFPVRVLRLGNAYRVPTAEVLAVLGISPAVQSGDAA